MRQTQKSSTYLPTLDAMRQNPIYFYSRTLHNEKKKHDLHIWLQKKKFFHFQKKKNKKYFMKTMILHHYLKVAIIYNRFNGVYGHN